MRLLGFLPVALVAGLALAAFALAGSSHTAQANDCDGAPDIAIGNVDEDMLSDVDLEPDDLEIEIRLFADGGIALVVNTPDDGGNGIPTELITLNLEIPEPADIGFGPTFATFCSPAAEQHPLTDIDGDGVPNRDDDCPDQEGPPENNGCPWDA